MCLALVRNCDAHFVSIESPALRAGETDLVVPVPGGAATVSGFGVVEIREEASTIDKVVSLEAGGTMSSFVVSLALIGNWDAHLIGVKGPMFRAGEADLVVPVPGGAATVSGLGVVEIREEASTIDKVVSLEAGGAVASFVVSFALISNWHTNLISVESPSLGAGETDLVVPVPGGTSNIGWLSVVEVGEDAGSLL